MRTLISVVALFVLFGADVFGAIGSWPKTTTYTRQFLGATNADAARTALGIVATNSDVLTVNETNSTSVTNLVGRIVTSNNIVVGTIGTNLLSQSAYDALVGGGDGGAGDATLAGDNTWTGTNIFNEEIQGLAFTIFTNGYGAFQEGLEAPTVYAPGYVNTPIVTNAENGSVVVEGVTFNDGGMDASNILTGTIDAARLPATNSSWKFDAGSANTLVVTNGRVGIGTASPHTSYLLHVGGLARATGLLSESYSKASATSYFEHQTRNRWYSWDDGIMGFTKQDGTTLLFANTNGLLFSPSGYLTTGAITVRSNSWTTPPTLSPGDISFLSQDGVPVVVSKDAGGVESTNRLDGVPAGIVTNNHAAAVTFSNDVTVASNLVVQGSSTFEALNVGELNVTNLNVGTLYLTNGIIRTTNALAGVNVVMGSSWFTNALQPFTLSGCSNFDGTNEVSAVVRVLNSSATNISVTVPTAWRTPDGSRVLWVTNGAIGIISVEVVGRQLTNAAMKCLW